MLLKFRCNSTFPSRDEVEAHFDGQGMRFVLRLPKPGPSVGETYDVEIIGPGIEQTPSSPVNWQRTAIEAQAERDSLRAEIEQMRKLLQPNAHPTPAVAGGLVDQVGQAAANQQHAAGNPSHGSDQSG